jgi:large subunit ribosomal protein L19
MARPTTNTTDLILVQVVPENDLRPATFSGIVMAVRNNGPMTRFTMRNVVKGAGPLERSFLLHSPFLRGITVHRKMRVRRNKLTYLRHKRDAESTFNV